MDAGRWDRTSYSYDIHDLRGDESLDKYVCCTLAEQFLRIDPLAVREILSDYWIVIFNRLVKIIGFVECRVMLNCLI